MPGYLSQRRHTGLRQQSGVALVVVVIILVLVLSSIYFGSISISDMKVEGRQETRDVLQEAKQALIDYAVMHASVTGAGNGIGGGDPGEYGYLPCPYQNNINDGRQEPNCDGQHENSIGLLPWASIEIEPLRDDSGNCLWYVVSGSYKNSPFPGLLNQDSNGMLQVVDGLNNVIVGNNPQDRVVAMVIAPGGPVAAQARVNNPGLLCGTDGTQAARYLDSNGVTDNASLVGIDHDTDSFVHADLVTADDAVNPYNDQFATITREEIWDVIYKTDIEDRMRELTEALAQCLAQYAGHATNAGRKLPLPAPMAADDYRDVADYDDVSVAQAALEDYAGRFPYVVDDSNNETAIAVADNFIEEPGLCNNLALPLTGGPIVDLTDEDQVHRKLYNNWKDHFFLAVSEAYRAAAGAYTACGDCVSVAGVDYAAVVFFAGSAETGQSRVYDDLIPQDDKSDINNYLENNNAADFLNVVAPKAFETSATGDIMFCLTDTNPPAVVAC